MAEYKAPLRDMRFVIKEVLEVDKLWSALAGTREQVDVDTADAILEEAAKIAAEAVAPLSREADEHGCRWQDHQVTTPPGFKEAYQTYAEGGWCGLGGNPAFGGMGMPKTLVAQVEEMVQGADMSFGLAPMLSAGACLSLDAHGSDALKQTYLPKLYDGTWAGAMDLTEPHAGTDLGMIRTRAEPDADGSYSLTGTKIFITWGEHDMAENIIHLVLAKLPDAPTGSKGISLFLVPKILVNTDGSLGERNAVTCGSIEKKMGIKASATCVMNYDGAKGWLVGEVNQGLACMFTMMNYERLGVGIQGLGAAEASYQNAADYACERLQGRSPEGIKNPDRAADPIIVHPDVRRMLLTMRAFNEGSRAFSTYVARWLDIAKFSDVAAEQEEAAGMVALLTPIAKAFITDKGLEATLIGQQVLGGHGFIREWGQEQLVRDTRITQIYEGTNGVQAMDLIGRKTVAAGGRYFRQFAGEVDAFIQANSDSEELAEFIQPLGAELARLQQVTEAVIAQAERDPNAPGAAAVEYLHLFGYTIYAYLWARMAKAALAGGSGGEADFYRAKLVVARFFFQRLLPQTQALSAHILAGSDTLMALEAELF
ncbi:acyl-CoA dehydrogenase [Exilibacterium tricleocarpae]|uniref:3-methylmercaptopropionyl-CoA dehydrogenase n=1 Tax=Exilibacterium tricleocarpae TaxID=2591008 RepID=A0A545T3P2_9GAMM|nr:acyl-CoA dehydrogenase C-terminal domain-containing protein [Exilibacterium tricleocarpae]TQV71830.1 acyl-CoA dehydrogenase [Exilibacterium tricleocarpae]